MCQETPFDQTDLGSFQTQNQPYFFVRKLECQSVVLTSAAGDPIPRETGPPRLRTSSSPLTDAITASAAARPEGGNQSEEEEEEEGTPSNLAADSATKREDFKLFV